MANNPKKHRNNDKVISLFALSVSGNTNLPLSSLNGADPMEHCALKKGEFVTINDSTDWCVTARGKVFVDSDPDSVISGYAYNYEMVAYEDGEIELTSETEAPLPAPRSRKNIGVGEVVTIYANVGVKWKLNNKLVNIIKREPKALRLAAGDKDGTCTITASYKRKGKTFTNSIKFTIVEPKSLRYSLANYEDYDFPNSKGPMVSHFKDTYAGTVGLTPQLLPTSVNFSKVLVREINCASIDSGHFAMNQTHCHIPNIPLVNNQCVGVGELARFKIKGNKSNIATHFDKVGGGDNDPHAQIGNGGSMIINIPVQWSLEKTNTSKELWKNLDTIHQEVILRPNGDISISKGNFRYIFVKSDHYPNSF